MRALLITGFLLLVVGTSPSAADIYKYRDAQGIIRYTYDLSEVPEDQRSQIQTYEEASSASDPSSPEVKDEDVTNGNNATPNEEPENNPVADKEKIEELKQRKKDLDEEFAGLMEEKYNLVKKKKEIEAIHGRNKEAVAEYEKKANELNKKIADYNKRRDSFQKEADAVKKAAENPES